MVKKEKPSPKKIRAIETKNKIYKAAEDLIRKYVFENVSVDSIVKAAGVAKGSFYVHFDSKYSLGAALINDYVSKVDLGYKSFTESFDVHTAASDILISLVGKIADIINLYLGYDNMKTVYMAQITKTINTDAMLNYNREIYKLFSDIISKGIQQGEFKTDIPADILTKHFIMAMRGITYEWCIRYPDFDLKEQALKHFEILLSGIKKVNRTPD